jgi:hypothetical protein
MEQSERERERKRELCKKILLQDSPELMCLSHSFLANRLLIEVRFGLHDSDDDGGIHICVLCTEQAIYFLMHYLMMAFK